MCGEHGEGMHSQDRPKTYLVVDERNLLRDTLRDEFQFETQVLQCENRVIVLVDIRSPTLFVSSSDDLQCFGERRYSSLQFPDLL